LGSQRLAVILVVLHLSFRMPDQLERLKAALADRYRIEEQIGAGGMATVYGARDLKHERRVALKLLRPELAAIIGTERFLREIRITAQLEHPHILTLIDSGQADSLLYYVLPLIEGESLRDRLDRENPLPIDEALRITTDVASAIGYAHRRNVIHRDIKPENILLHEGEAMVMDFGIAIAVSAAAGERMTETGLSIGTPEYMSPEQATGSQNIDQRSDVYSLGCVLFELLAGEPPHTGPNVQAIIAKVLTDKPQSLRVIRDPVPTLVDAAVMKALSKLPADRFATATEFAEALTQPTPRASVPVAVKERPRRASWRMATMLVTAIFLVAAGWFVIGRRATVSSAPAAAGPEAPRGPSIAVLPFSNESGPDQEYFSVGLTEGIITELSRYRELAVIAHFATADFKKVNADADLAEIGATLKARYVLQGSVFRQGDRIRINVRLSDAVENRSVWGNSYERDLTVQDLFAIQDDLTQQVVSAIAGTYGAVARAGLSALRGKAPSSLRSYDCVLRTYDYLQNHTTENHALARECLEKVVEAEPDYAEGLAWLGYIYAEEYHHRRNERLDEYDALDRALELGLEAIRLDGASHVAHGTFSLTYYFRGDYERARVENRRAIELAPNNAMWLVILGLYHIQREEFEEGVPMVNRAIELFTPHPPGWVRMGTFLDHYAHERYEEALAEVQATELGEDLRGPLFLAANYGQLGRTADAQPVLEELRRLWTLPASELRAEMIERHAYSPGLTDHLLDGLTKAGW